MLEIDIKVAMENNIMLIFYTSVFNFLNMFFINMMLINIKVVMENTMLIFDFSPKTH